MGGGKTHNLLALGLLAKHPAFRPEGDEPVFYDPDSTLGEVKVIAFSGRVEWTHRLASGARC